MKISIFGLGYVGAVTAGCLTRRGHTLVGVDVQPEKIEAFNSGISPIVEPELSELLQTAKAKKLLRATLDATEAIQGTELSIVCVGTPSTATGSLDLRFVQQVLQQIAVALRTKQTPHALVVRSTMLPGNTRRLADETLSALESDGRLSIFYQPEFLREGTAVADFENPSLAAVGTRDGSPPPTELMSAIFGTTAAIVNWETAEMLKYACNTFHAAKISFANEIGRAGKQFGVDARKVMELLCQDTKLNLSPYYMRPGNPFGGSCLPKDVRAFAGRARQDALQLPLIDNLLASNDRHRDALISVIVASGQNEIVILGLSFKSGTDDLRESAMVEVAQTLLGRGFQVRIYDPALNLAALVGANKREIDAKMPHLASLLHVDLVTAIGKRGTIVAAQKCAKIADLAKCVTPAHSIVDVNGWPELEQLAGKYEGFCW
jgi:GDP-mannose 6-dehydrogenase